jgi:hypothetical protein
LNDRIYSFDVVFCAAVTQGLMSSAVAGVPPAAHLVVQVWVLLDCMMLDVGRTANLAVVVLMSCMSLLMHTNLAQTSKY